MPFSRIFRRDAHRIEIELIVIGFREPEQRFVPAGKAFRGVETMPEMPDNSVAQAKIAPLEKRIIIDVQRKHFAMMHEIADLPAKAAVRPQRAIKLRDDLRLRLKIVVNRDFRFVRFP